MKIIRFVKSLSWKTKVKTGYKLVVAGIVIYLIGLELALVYPTIFLVSLAISLALLLTANALVWL